MVKIRIGSTDQEFELSKDLICKQSPYFASMFEGDFSKGEEQTATLNEIDGVVSIQSFQMLTQWLYTGNVTLGRMQPKKAITAIIEFLRLADMCQITGMEEDMVD
jgi:hypothetical protein